MIEERAKVVSVNDNQILVSASRTSACAQCAAKDNCGQSAVSQWAASKMIDIAVNNPSQIALVAGDDVIVGINEQSFIKASLLLYFVPLLVMFVAGGAASWASVYEGGVVMISFAALLASFWAIRIYSKKMSNQSTYQLIVLSVVD